MEPFFKVHSYSYVVKKKLKSGQRQTCITAESIPFEDIDTGKKAKHCRCFKAKVLEPYKKKETADASCSIGTINGCHWAKKEESHTIQFWDVPEKISLW